MDTFGTDLQRWIDCDNEVAELRHRLALLREEKRSREIAVLAHVRRLNLGRARINLEHGYVTFGIHTNRPAPTIQIFKRALEATDISEDQRVQVLANVDALRPGKRIPVVRRVATTEYSKSSIEDE